MGKGELSADVAARLPVSLRNAMAHPFRRQLLRRLEQGGGEQSAAQLREGGCIPCTLACISYHLGVLIEAGLVRRVPTGSAEGRLIHVFSPVLEGQPGVLEVLQATALTDGRHLEPARA